MHNAHKGQLSDAEEKGCAWRRRGKRTCGYHFGAGCGGVAGGGSAWYLFGDNLAEGRGAIAVAVLRQHLLHEAFCLID